MKGECLQLCHSDGGTFLSILTSVTELAPGLPVFSPTGILLPVWPLPLPVDDRMPILPNNRPRVLFFDIASK